MTKFHGIYVKKKAISEYTKNIILYSAKSSEEIEIDEHFVSYYSEEGELFFLIWNICTKNASIFWNHNSENDS